MTDAMSDAIILEVARTFIQAVFIIGALAWVAIILYAIGSAFYLLWRGLKRVYFYFRPPSPIRFLKHHVDYSRCHCRCLRFHRCAVRRGELWHLRDYKIRS